MIQIENTEVVGFEAAIRGMRNPMNSWDKKDSFQCNRTIGCFTCDIDGECEVTSYRIGKSDHELMMKLAKAGSVHAKYRRMITVYMDITAPLYWWKEFDTYKVGTVANSCSTMHKIHEKEFTVEDFSYDHLIRDRFADNIKAFSEVSDPTGDISVFLNPLLILRATIDALNVNREAFLKTKDKKFWWQMIQLLPSSYNQRRTIMLNYEVLAGIYPMRKDHKLDEWHGFCDWIAGLPYSEIITLGEGDGKNEDPRDE